MFLIVARVLFKSSFSLSGNGSACTSHLHHIILGLPCGAVQKQTCPHSHTAGGPTWPLHRLVVCRFSSGLILRVLTIFVEPI